MSCHTLIPVNVWCDYVILLGLKPELPFKSLKKFNLRVTKMNNLFL